MTASVDWYFDFVSPYACLCLHRLKEIPARIIYKPVLFAGLLQHWGHKGPAEIAAKRRWTYRYCVWRARTLRIPFRFPAEHPFNPLQHLRLALACGSRPEPVKRIFESLWTTGANATDPEALRALCGELGVDPSRLAADEIKSALRRNGEEAVAAGVFGVPSFVAGGQVFWGEDAVTFVADYLSDRTVIDSPEMRRVDELPVGAARKA